MQLTTMQRSMLERLASKSIEIESFTRQEEVVAERLDEAGLARMGATMLVITPQGRAAVASTVEPKRRGRPPKLATPAPMSPPPTGKVEKPKPVANGALVFVDELPGNRSRSGRNSWIAPFVEALAANPGKWAKVREAPTTDAAGMARNNARMSAKHNGWPIEVAVRQLPGEPAIVYARYVGDPSKTKATA